MISQIGDLLGQVAAAVGGEHPAATDAPPPVAVARRKSELEEVSDQALLREGSAQLESMMRSLSTGVTELEARQAEFARDMR